MPIAVLISLWQVPELHRWVAEEGGVDGRGGAETDATAQPDREQVGHHRKHHRRTVPPFLPSTDNAVKNHFYCRLRKGLKKINTALLASQGKLGKEFKPNILYRIVEVAEEIFKASPNF